MIARIAARHVITGRPRRRRSAVDPEAAGTRTAPKSGIEPARNASMLSRHSPCALPAPTARRCPAESSYRNTLRFERHHGNPRGPAKCSGNPPTDLTTVPSTGRVEQALRSGSAPARLQLRKSPSSTHVSAHATTPNYRPSIRPFSPLRATPPSTDVLRRSPRPIRRFEPQPEQTLCRSGIRNRASESINPVPIIACRCPPVRESIQSWDGNTRAERPPYRPSKLSSSGIQSFLTSQYSHTHTLKSDAPG